MFRGAKPKLDKHFINTEQTENGRAKNTVFVAGECFALPLSRICQRIGRSVLITFSDRGDILILSMRGK